MLSVVQVQDQIVY